MDSFLCGMVIIVYSRKSLTQTHWDQRVFGELKCAEPILFIYKVDQEIFTLKIIRVKNFRVDKFSRFRSILTIFLCKMFHLRVKFSWLISTAKLF